MIGLSIVKTFLYANYKTNGKNLVCRKFIPDFYGKIITSNPVEEIVKILAVTRSVFMFLLVFD